jgi:Predicted transcriptional regulators
MKSLGEKIRELRNSLGLSQEELAEELGITSKSIQRYESSYSRPDTYTLVKLATYFDISTDYLLGLAGIKDQLEEIKHKVLKNGRQSICYRHYLYCKNNYEIDEKAEYYWIYSEENIIGGQTMWVGWADKNCKLEIRRLRPVYPKKAIEACTEVYGKPMVLNYEEDAIVFRMFGGQAIVKREICEQFIPEYLEDFVGENPELNIYK